MFGCGCFHWNSVAAGMAPSERETFSLPAPLPQWSPGQGFATGRINLGELEVVKISRLEFVWSCTLLEDKKKRVSFYKPIGIPDGFHVLGHCCQLDDKPLRGFVLAAREVCSESEANSKNVNTLPLKKPLDYTLVWSSDDGSDENLKGCGFFWLPQPPEGHEPMGYLVTDTPRKPELDEVRCVRADLTDKCDAYRVILNASSRFSELPFQVWSTRPHHRGILGRGVSVGTFFCSSFWIFGEELSVSCLKNLDPTLNAMPTCDQIHAVISHYGPTVFFHPDEIYLPSSVSWFFKNGALLYRKGESAGEAINTTGSNLPCGGSNDGDFWIDLPNDDRRESLKLGNMESAKLFVHVKPAVGGTFTDIVMWVFCPFNGPATIKIGLVSIGLNKIGQHVGDWEHFTLRICNFTGELWGIYFSQHSGGEWIEACDLEYKEGNKAIVYSSKNGHASFSHPGTYIQGSSKLGIGIRNDCDRSDFYVDSSKDYELIAAEYLGEGIVLEPCWLQFMREWGPTIIYDSRHELDKIINRLPLTLRYSVQNIFAKLPVELSGEEGPTGPKEKNNWVGDERS